MSRLHIYAFGSVCRGEILPGSDVDLIAITSGGINDLSRSMFSIYSHERVRELWKEGNPFSWHLHLESKLIYSSDGLNFIEMLGAPSRYSNRVADCMRFFDLLRHARVSAETDRKSVVFDLSAAFLAIRNFSSCFVLRNYRSDFSRNVAWRLMGAAPPITLVEYGILERSRLLCTRGYGPPLSDEEIGLAIGSLRNLEKWMITLLGDLPNDE